MVRSGLSLLSAQQLALVDRWDGQPAPARDAATVAVLRDGPAGRETFLLRAHTQRQLRAIGDRPVAEAATNRVITAIEPTLVEIDGVRYLDGPADEEQC